MRLNKILKNALLVISAGIILTACATKKEVAVEAPKKEETKKEETKKEEVTKIEKIVTFIKVITCVSFKKTFLLPFKNLIYAINGKLPNIINNIAVISTFTLSKYPIESL